MVSVWPQLLFLTPLSPTLLRITVGCIFLYVAYIQWTRRDAIARTRYPVVGSGEWIVWVGIVYEVVVALMLIVGWRAQIAAVLGLIAAAKFFFLKRRYPEIIPLSHITSILMFVIFLSLLITGAGLFAADLPL